MLGIAAVSFTASLVENQCIISGMTTILVAVVCDGLREIILLNVMQHKTALLNEAFMGNSFWTSVSSYLIG
jgi:hypothetical protein